MFSSIHPKRSLVVVVTSLMLLATACGSSSDSLAESSWTIDELVGADLPAVVIATLDFIDDSRLAAHAGCNDFTGTYETDGDTISIGPLAGTLKACADLVMAFETTYTAALDRASTYGVDGDVLTLRGPAGAILATFDRFEADLAGTAWQVISYNNGNEAVVSVALGTEITLAFGDDGTLAGSGGCNNYSGGYEVDGADVSIGPLASTEKFCAEPEGVMDQEALYLAALQSATTWQISGTTLELRDDSGALQVSALLG